MGPISRLIISIKRNSPLDKAWLSVNNAIDLKQQSNGYRVVALDFCGVNTVDFPFTEKHKEMIEHGKKNGLQFVSHFAELQNEQDLGTILSASPCRIGHALWMDEAI